MNQNNFNHVKNMPTNSTNNEKIVKDFLKTLESQQSARELEKFYHPEAEQIEFPNAILKNKTTRNREALKESFEKGLKIMSKQEYEIQNLYSCGNAVILEAVWKGTISMPIGDIPVDGQMIAYFAQFFEFKDGKIYKQRNYDCFEPFKLQNKKAPIIGLQTAIYKVGDITVAKEWYAKAFRVVPNFDQSFYVGFTVGGYELGIQPEDEQTAVKPESVVVFWGVENIELEYKRFLDLGATENQSPMSVGGNIITASVKDPWGNVIGLIYNPDFKIAD